MMIGSQVVCLYEGTIPQGGASIIEFAGHKLCHRSIVKDGSDYLVHVKSRAIIMSYPAKTERSIVLDHLADNIEKLDHFLDSPQSYEMVSPDELLSKKKNVATIEAEHSKCTKEPSYSRSGKFAHLNKDQPTKKKSYNVKDSKWD